MKALVYHGTKDVRMDSVPDPEIIDPDDIILRVTATAICGSDLLFRGKVREVKHGDILGHEFMGVVEEVGPEVTQLHCGDRVVVPFTISCGECFFCERQLYSACERTNTGRGAIVNKSHTRPGAAMFGYSHLYGGAFRMGQTNVQRFMPELLQFIEDGALHPDEIITHEMPLSEAARGYKIFNGKDESCRKVVLYPNGNGGARGAWVM